MKASNIGIVLNVGVNDNPERIQQFVSELASRGITLVGKRGSAQGAGQSAARSEVGPWEAAWCKLKGVSRVRRTEGRNFEQAAYHNFMTQAPDNKPKGLRAPKD